MAIIIHTRLNPYSIGWPAGAQLYIIYGVMASDGGGGNHLESDARRKDQSIDLVDALGLLASAGKPSTHMFFLVDRYTHVSGHARTWATGMSLERT